MSVIALMLTACTSNSEEGQTSQVNNELISQGKEFASIHNDCLSSIYQYLISHKTRSISESLENSTVKAANLYISKHLSPTRSDTTLAYLKLEDYTKSIEEIRSEMSPEELFHIDKFISNTNDGDKILEDITKDNKLTEIQKRAVICFITTYNASHEYWQQNLEEWRNKIGGSPAFKKFRFNWKEVLFADAYWGFEGLRSSGLNGWVGAGSAALGSAFACLK